MNFRKCVGKLLSAFMLAGFLPWIIMPGAYAQDATAVDQVVEGFLESLLEGDIQGIRQLMSEQMQAKNKQLALYPDTYMQFLQKYYAGVETAVEELKVDGEKIQAHIRFFFQNSNTTESIFILRQIDGQWKISDEIY